MSWSDISTTLANIAAKRTGCGPLHVHHGGSPDVCGHSWKRKFNSQRIVDERSCVHEQVQEPSGKISGRSRKRELRMLATVPGKPCRVQLPSQMIYGRIQRTLRFEDLTLKPAPARKRRFEPFSVPSFQATAVEGQRDGHDGGDDHHHDSSGMQRLKRTGGGAPADKWMTVSRASPRHQAGLSSG